LAGDGVVAGYIVEGHYAEAVAPKALLKVGADEMGDAVALYLRVAIMLYAHHGVACGAL
jgi:hypothetical protein